MDSDLKKLQDNLTARFDTVESKIDDVRQAVGVLHEAAMSSFRFTLEALDGKEQQINARISKESAELKAMLRPVADAVQHLSSRKN